MKNRSKLEEFWKDFFGTNRNKRITANSFAKEMVKKIVLDKGTADPFSIAEQLNIEIRWETFGPHPLGQTAYFDKCPIILLNESIRDSVQRNFTCGHELGHIICQPGITGYQTGRLSHGVCEYQANQFATGLMGLLYVEENGCGPDSYYDLVHHYGSPIDMLD
ncbi:ImmA/IrrE family metallo-endopeptidase [Lentilactobacillus parabuchneri]|uniref:ImmA/IrrE family metallo-endopeptidase n=1 Tax=Lentilactobacillus parabuchneri TaxID=152331 RepID=UPI000A10FE81|nr:ImmA/IrrE family metallo-endopeptidase [Lentilactobacillus parabuchneri]